MSKEGAVRAFQEVRAIQSNRAAIVSAYGEERYQMVLKEHQEAAEAALRRWKLYPTVKDRQEVYEAAKRLEEATPSR